MLLALATLVTGLLPAAAQEGIWKAYLFNASTGELLQINADSSQASYTLGIDNNDGSYTGGFDLAFSPDGLRAAYCRMRYATTPETPTAAELIVHDLVSGQDVLRQPMRALQACRTGADSFNEDGTRLAVGIVNGFTGDPGLPAGYPSWEYQIIDATNGNLLAALTPEAAPVSELPWANNSVLMLTERFAGEGVIFKVAAYASEGTFDDAYLWNFREGSLVATPYWNSIGVDWLPTTGEYAVSVLDPNYPVGEPLGPVPIYNVTQVASPAETRTVFTGGAEWLLLDQVFVNDGRSLAMLMLSAYDNNDPNAPSRTRWTLLERDGRLQDLYIGEWFSDLRAIPGGYLLFTQDTPPASGTGATSYSLRIGSGEAMQTIWQSPPADTYQGWEFIWTTPFTPAENLEPFTAIP
jgi:hypothetical protein